MYNLYCTVCNYPRTFAFCVIIFCWRSAQFFFDTICMATLACTRLRSRRGCWFEYTKEEEKKGEKKKKKVKRGFVIHHYEEAGERAARN